MKNKKKIKKTPVRVRRSNLISIKKSPLARRNPYRITRNASKTFNIQTYESPLKHFYNNENKNGNSATFFTSTSAFQNEELKINQRNVHNKSEKLCSVINLPSTSKNINDLTETEKENIGNERIDQEINTNLTSSTETQLKHSITENKSLNSSKNASSTSILSNFDKIDMNRKSNSIIIIDDPYSSPLNKSVLNNSKTNTFFNQLDKNPINVEPLANNEDIIVIESNDTLPMETEINDNSLKQNVVTSLPESNTNLMDSVIVIDDEVPVQRANSIPKPNEDCSVIWSSLSNKSASKTNTPKTKKNAGDFLSSKLNVNVNSNSRFPKYNNFVIDTQPNVNNLKSVNNQNYNLAKTKKPLVKPPNVKSKAGIKPTTELKLMKPSTNVKKVKKISPVKNNKKSLKKKSKNNGELIFLSESQNDKEETKTKNGTKGQLREIVIDGNNVAMAYTRNKFFSEQGIKLLIDYFKKRGHTIKVFIPQHRTARNRPLLFQWFKEGIVIFTPSRKLGNKSYTPYDDRYILEYATACKGIVVSQDQFRDLYEEKPEYRDTIENRLLIPTFVGDYVMFPEDPLGRNGPGLTDFLRH